MANSTELYESIRDLFVTFESKHNAGTKKGAMEARKNTRNKYKKSK